MKHLILSLTFIAGFYTYGQDNRNRPNKPPTTDQLIKEMDSNGDGLISFEEVKGPLKNDFLKVDLDQDGFLSKAELDKAPKPEHPPKNAR